MVFNYKTLSVYLHQLADCTKQFSHLVAA